MIITAPIVCELPGRKPEDPVVRGVRSVEFEIREATVREAPICVMFPDEGVDFYIKGAAFRRYENKFWVRESADYNELDRSFRSSLKALDENLKPYREAWSPFASTRGSIRRLYSGVTSATIKDDVLASSHCLAAVQERARRTLMVDGIPYVESAGPVMNAWPGLYGGGGRCRMYWDAMRPTIGPLAHSFGMADREFLEEVCDHFDQHIEMVESSSPPLTLDDLPDQTVDFDAINLEHMAWHMLGWRQETPLGKFKVEDVERLRDLRALLRRRYPSAEIKLTGKSYDAWAGELDKMEIVSADEFLPTLEDFVSSSSTDVENHTRFYIASVIERRRIARLRANPEPQDLAALGPGF